MTDHHLPEPRSAAERNELVRLANIYSWDIPPEEAILFPHRLLLRVMDIGTLEDLIAMESRLSRDRLRSVLRSAAIGSLRPKSWTFWHYRLGLVEPGRECPPMPKQRIAA